MTLTERRKEEREELDVEFDEDGKVIIEGIKTDITREEWESEEMLELRQKYEKSLELILDLRRKEGKEY
jgi:hypothetical protein